MRDDALNETQTEIPTPAEAIGETVAMASHVTGVVTSTSGDGTRFRVLRPHARGGLGEVSVAEDIELHREVALKQIQSQHADDPASRSRFVLEAEVTGGLEHPGIVPVYGLGQYPDGRPYYAMRFIQGDCLQEAVDRFHQPREDASDPTQRSLELRQLLGRFVDVCNAIEYAHARGVLHRDLKPGNIMLGKYGETLVVDWGLAKLVGRDDVVGATEETTLEPASGSGSAPTQMGRAVGTPAYMPPEQASGNLDQLGPASDVYSLGATLYYVLTGQAPVGGRNLPEVLDKVQSGNIPPPRSVKQDIPLPLNAICRRAMSLRPQDRYRSPRELAEDLERYLADEPVTALAEPLPVRTRRWMRKHPTPVAAIAATVLVGLISGFSLAAVVAGKNEQLADANTDLDDANQQLQATNSDLIAANNAALLATGRARTQAERARSAEQLATAEAARAKEQEALARRRAEEAELTLGFFQDQIIAAARPEGLDGGLGIDTTIREAVEAAEPRISETFKELPLTEASIRNALGATYRDLGESELAIAQHERAVQLAVADVGPRDRRTLETQDNLGRSYRAAGRVDEAIRVLKETLRLRKEVLGEEHTDTLTTMNNLALAYETLGRRTEAIDLFETVLAQRTRTDGPDQRATLTAMSNLANSYRNDGRVGEAIRLHEEALNRRRQTLGPEHPDTVASMNNLAFAYAADKRYEEAIPLFDQSLELSLDRFGRDHPDVQTLRINLAMAHRAGGHSEEAIPLLQAVVKTRSERYGQDHPKSLFASKVLALAYRSAGDLENAIKTSQDVFRVSRLSLGAAHPDTIKTMQSLARLLISADRSDEVLAIYEEFQSGQPDAGSGEDDVPHNRLALAATHLMSLKLFERAETYLRKCLQLREQLMPDDWLTANARSMLGEALTGQQKFEEAEPLLISGYQQLQESAESIPEPSKRRVAAARQRLVDLYVAWGKPDEAQKWREADPGGSVKMSSPL